jgi:hypothetical protein
VSVRHAGRRAICSGIAQPKRFSLLLALSSRRRRRAVQFRVMFRVYGLPVWTP